MNIIVEIKYQNNNQNKQDNEKEFLDGHDDAPYSRFVVYSL